MVPLVLALAILALGTAAPAAAQATGAGEPSASQPTFKSGVDLVRFDVRVVDGAGRPIRDIRADEIEIVEGGETMPVVLFQRVTEPAESYVEAATRAVTAEVSSNDAFPRGHLYLLIFDQQHITPGNEQRARMAAEQFIRRRVRPSDRVALFAVPGPGPQVGFTADKLKAINELVKVRGSYQRTVATPLGTMGVYEAHRIAHGDEKALVDAMARMNSEAGADLLATQAEAGRTTTVGTATTESPGIQRRLLVENARTIVARTDADSRQFLQRLADVIAGFREIEGRKTVVLFSEGFFQDNLSRELENVAAAAAQSYCVFYTFDLNQRFAGLTDAYAPETTLDSEVQARIAPMATMAIETDGTMVIDAAARSAGALDLLADQAQEYYLVGFTPSEEARLNRGQYRRVKVRVRRPGATVSARTGYALAPETAVPDRRRAINTVLGAPFVQQGLRIEYTTYVMKALEDAGHRVVLSLDVDLPTRSRPDEAADVVFVARDVRDGRVVASGTDSIALPAAPRPGAALGTGHWRVQFAVPPGDYIMRTVVREPGGLVGSADRRLEVHPLDGPDVSVSDLVIGSALGALPVRPRAYTGDGLSGIIEAYGRTPVQLQDLAVTLELRGLQAGTPALVYDADLQEVEADASGLSRRARFLLPLDKVEPGHYVAHAIVSARGEVVAERTRQVEVLAGRAVPPAADAPPAVSPDVPTPAEMMQAEVGRSYVTSLLQLANGSDAFEAARRASQGRWEQVELELKRVAEPLGFVPQALQGLALFVREDYAGASASLKRAFVAQPDNAPTAFFLGWAYRGAGDVRSAIGAWRSAALLDASMVSAHLALADAYLSLSQPALAMQALSAGLLARPESPELLARLQEIHRRQP